MSVFYIFLSIFFLICFYLYILSRRNINYWKNKNVPFVKPLPFFGNYAGYILLQEYVGHVVRKLCKRFPESPYFGAFYGTEPVLIVQCPELLKLIFTKDFYYFNGREISPHVKKEFFTRNNVFFNFGDKWKNIRQNLTPLFTTGKMKNMFYLINKCSYDFEDMLERETSASNIFEAKDMSIRFTMDTICSCILGVQADTMNNSENNSFRYIGNEIFKSTYYRGFKLVFRSAFPDIFYSLGFTAFPDTIGNFFSKLLKEIFEKRNHKPSTRKDIIDLVLTWKNNDFITCDSINNTKTGLNEKVQQKVDDDLLMAQVMSFFAAGFETTATVMSFTFYEWAKNIEVQKRAAKEVDEYLRRHDNKLNYECVTEMPYLEACLYETLRMYPILGNMTREVMDDYIFPDGLTVDKGVRIHIPVYTLHHNPDFFPDPEEYKPERFLSGNKENIKQYTFFPYGEGPRLCIGQRLSKMKAFSGFITFLKTYEVVLAEGMPENVSFDCRAFLTAPLEKGLYLKIQKRDGWETRIFNKTM